MGLCCFLILLKLLKPYKPLAIVIKTGIYSVMMQLRAKAFLGKTTEQFSLEDYEISMVK